MRWGGNGESVAAETAGVTGRGFCQDNARILTPNKNFNCKTDSPSIYILLKGQRSGFTPQGKCQRGPAGRAGRDIVRTLHGSRDRVLSAASQNGKDVSGLRAKVERGESRRRSGKSIGAGAGARESQRAGNYF